MNLGSSQPASGGFLQPENIVGYFGVREGMRVADFGSGTGYFAILISKLIGASGIITAVDIRDEALESVRGRAKAEGLNNIDTVRSNLEILGSSGLADDSQDIVLLANILFQNSKKEEILKEARRITKPAGKVIVINWRKGTNGFGPPDELRTNPEEMQQIALAAGLQLIEPFNAGDFHYGLIFKKR